jgi:hypothetical protein
MWWSCTKWNYHVFPNLINILWVLRTPLTHKTTHKKLQVSFDALAPSVGGILADRLQGGSFFSFAY